MHCCCFSFAGRRVPALHFSLLFEKLRIAHETIGGLQVNIVAISVLFEDVTKRRPISKRVAECERYDWFKEKRCLCPSKPARSRNRFFLLGAGITPRFLSYVSLGGDPNQFRNQPDQYTVKGFQVRHRLFEGRIGVGAVNSDSI